MGVVKGFCLVLFIGMLVLLSYGKAWAPMGFTRWVVQDAPYGSGWDGDTSHAPSQNATYDQMELQCLESVFGTSLGNGMRLATAALTSDRFMTGLALTQDTSISEAQIIANATITNQGDAGEADLTLPAVSYNVCVRFRVEEAQNIEINPPSGELFDLDGVALDADDCVDSDSTVGSVIVACRGQNAAGTWQYFLDTARGVWTDTGASD